MALNRMAADMITHPVTAVASAGTCDIGATVSDRLSITGTTTITSFGTEPNKVRFLSFVDAVTLTYNATSLILPTSSNITTAAGDTAMFSSDASGNWTCLAYQRRNGTPLVAGDYSITAVASAGTTDILGAASDRISITGTTTITSLGTGTNKVKFVSFTGALTLTHNATSLILPTGANITTAAGDCMIVSSDGSSNVTVLTYMRKSGKEIYANAAYLDAAQAYTKAQRGTPVALSSSSASIASDFANGNNFTHTTTEDTTLANPSNLVAGQSGAIVITQDASTARTMSFGSYWKFEGGTAPTLTATTSAVDVLLYYVESSTRITALMLNNVS